MYTKNYLFRCSVWLVCWLLAGVARMSAQQLKQFSVASFELDQFDVTAKSEQCKRLDGNGSVYAIIKVSSNQPDDQLEDYRFNFGLMNHEVVPHGDELWVYVQRNAKRVTISRKGYATISQYDLNTTIEEGYTYLMKLTTASVQEQNTSMSDAGAFSVITEPLGATITIDDEQRGVSPLQLTNLAKGQHIIVASKDGYENAIQTFDTTDGKDTNLHLVLERDTNIFTVKGVTFVMKVVQGGTFKMGATKEQNYPYKDEKPVHRVTLSDYRIGETEVTQALWQAVMGSNPSRFIGENRPVEQVSWNDCQTFIEKLNALTGQRFRLPTEAEWEYAARGGSKSHGYQYSGSNSLNDVAWWAANSGRETHDVKTKQANELGIYDMSGNVWEWCLDWKDSYSRGAVTNPIGSSSGSRRVDRGGGWAYYARFCRVANRGSSASDKCIAHLGLRLAL